MGYTYYPTGQLKSITYPSYGTVANPTATYAYNSTGQMAAVSDWDGHTTTFSDNANGNLTTTSYANGDTWTIGYDGTDAVMSMALTANGAVAASVSYTRDSTELVTNEADAGDLSSAATYSYDPASQLISAATANTGTTQSTNYTTATEPATLPDGAAATYGSSGQLLTATQGSQSASYWYDSLGARTQVTTSGTKNTYGYSALGQLTSVTAPGKANVRLAYGPTGALTTRSTESGVTTLTWDAGSGSKQLLSDEAVDFIYGPNASPVEQVTLTTSTPTYMAEDQLGSVRVLTAQTGSVSGTLDYGPYGAVTSSTGAEHAVLGYAGELTTTATGLIVMGSRDYTPSTGQFLSVDPLVTQSTLAYVYTADDPVNRTDPTGMWTHLGGCGRYSFTYYFYPYWDPYPIGSTETGDVEACLYYTGGWRMVQFNITYMPTSNATATGAYFTIHAQLKTSGGYTTYPATAAETLGNTKSIKVTGTTPWFEAYWPYNGYYYGILWRHGTITTTFTMITHVWGYV